MRVWNVQDHPVTIPRGTEWALANPYADVPHEDCVAALASNVVKLQEQLFKQKAHTMNVNRVMKKGLEETSLTHASLKSEALAPSGLYHGTESLNGKSTLHRVDSETPGLAGRETGTGAEQLLKEHWPRTRKEMFKRLWAELNFDSPDVKLTRREKIAVVKVFASVPKALALGPFDVGLVKGIELAIETGDHPPIADKCRPLSRKRLEALKAQVKRWLGQGVAEWTDGPWASATVVVKKTNGGLRFCADYRALNQITERDARPVAHLGEKLSKLKSRRDFSTPIFTS